MRKSSLRCALGSLVLAALAAAGCGDDPGPGDAATAPAPDDPQPPNVLLLVWDTVRADRLSIHGYPRETTPRLAALARDGQVFEWAVSPAMWTLPGHASLFTGLPVTTHGVTTSHKWLKTISMPAEKTSSRQRKLSLTM